MARTYSQQLARNTPIPDFDLPATNAGDGGVPDRVRLSDHADAAVLVVVFTCNHCPYARHVEDSLVRLARDNAGKGVRFVAISSNDADEYPDDSFDALGARAREKGYPFPYLYDESQDVAQAFGAVCTPDPFVYRRHEDGVFRLTYHGQVDASRPGSGVSTGDDLRRGIEDALAARDLTFDAVPSMGCNIKWRD